MGPAARVGRGATEPVVSDCSPHTGAVAPRPTRAAGPTPTLVAPGAVPGMAPGVVGANGAAAARSRPTGPARFRLVRRLGSGGFGRVWLAHDARLGHTVALKAAHVRDAETEERIRREAHALATVRHPHCVQIHDLVPADSDPGLAELDGMVIVMEYVRGESLGELVRTRGTLDDVAAARVWSSIAGALDAAHGHGVLHRDVKPGNIVLDADGQAHLIDFGIARKTGDATLTATGRAGHPGLPAARGRRGRPGDRAVRLLAAGGDRRVRPVRAAAARRPRGRGVRAACGRAGRAADAPAAPVGAPGAAARRAGRRPGPPAAAARGAPGAGRLVAVGRGPPRRAGRRPVRPAGDGARGTGPRDAGRSRPRDRCSPDRARSAARRRRRESASCWHRSGPVSGDRCDRDPRDGPPEARRPGIGGLPGRAASPIPVPRTLGPRMLGPRAPETAAARRRRRRTGRRAGRDGVGAHPARDDRGRCETCGGDRARSGVGAVRGARRGRGRVGHAADRAHRGRPHVAPPPDCWCAARWWRWSGWRSSSWIRRWR